MLNEEIIFLGWLFFKFFMDVYFGKFLFVVVMFGCLDLVLIIVVMLNFKSLFVILFGFEL